MFRKKLPEMVYLSSDEDELLTDDESLEDRLSKINAAGMSTMNDPPQVKIQFNKLVDGIKVEMPVRPYPCQEAVISAIINGCRTQQHCLLESPTGSGKTLALLCGSLAWQSDYAKKILEGNEQDKKQKKDKNLANGFSSFGGKIYGEKSCQIDEDFNLDDVDWSDDCFSDSESSSAQKIPKIYYGSRTHRQIGQIIKELRKTCYSDKRMTILSSREVTCIHDSDRDKTQLCNELLDPSKKCGCPYYTESNKYALSSNSRLDAYGIESPWDIEDLVIAGKTAMACPYFAARSLMAEADIIFCPYNYIIDPVIRESMQIDLKGAIIILDEAHNIENICRDCGSISLSSDGLENLIKECDNLIQMALTKHQMDELGYVTIIEKFAKNLHLFVTTMHLKQQANSDSLNSDQWTGVDFVNVLEINRSINLTEINNFTKAAREASSMYNTAMELLRLGKPTPPTMSYEMMRLTEKISTGLKMVTSVAHANDYRVLIRQTPQGFKKEKTLEFMCMNPGVIFVPICDMARTVILASGTLAPTNSYQGELGVKFPFIIQADHVTPQEQVFIKCIPKGPTGKSMRATYQNVNTWDFQDDLGEILLTVCEAVPHGILMFFSSYSVMGNLLKRWKTSGMLNKLLKLKKIFQEPRGNADLSSMMGNYRQVIRDTSNGPCGAITGALLFAVFRGKVAEGEDFSDNEARCVLTVGIPYSVRNDPPVDMKFGYNDLNRSKGVLSGNEWYTIQAFRALNQALGRVIRHQNDWGAILLIDERFLELRNINLLPAWVRTMWIRQTKMDSDLRQMLKCFVAKQIKRNREKCRKLSNF